MIGKIFQSTKAKKCSCPAHKSCTGSKTKNTLKPHIYVEDAKRLPVPIKITRYKDNKPTIRYKEQRTITKKDPKRKEKATKHKEEKSQWEKQKIQAPIYSYYESEPTGVKEKKNYIHPTLQYTEKKGKTLDYLDTPKRKSRLSEWYQKRRAKRELKTNSKRERKREKKENSEREKEDRLNEALFRKLYSPKKKNIFAKAQAESRHISVKNYNRYDDISNKFVNCCYRLCCQIYCCLSVIIILGFVIILLI